MSVCCSSFPAVDCLTANSAITSHTILMSNILCIDIEGRTSNTVQILGTVCHESEISPAAWHHNRLKYQVVYLWEQSLPVWLPQQTVKCQSLRPTMPKQHRMLQIWCSYEYPRCSAAALAATPRTSVAIAPAGCKQLVKVQADLYWTQESWCSMGAVRVCDSQKLLDEGVWLL